MKKGLPAVSVSRGWMNPGVLSVLAVGLVFCGALAAQERGLPVSVEDDAYGQKLIENGYADLAVTLYKAMRDIPGISAEARIQAGMGLLGAYRALSTEVDNAEERACYIHLARILVRDLIAPYDEKTVPVHLLYEKAVLTQTQGRSIAVNLPKFTEADERAALISRSEKEFDEARKLFEQVQKRAFAEEAVLNRNPEKNVSPLGKLRALRTKSALKLCWTGRYKALLYPDGSPERSKRFTTAVKNFDNFIRNYQTDMSVLSGLYGRGMCHRDVGEDEKAIEDFVQITGISREMQEIAGLRVECSIQIAQIYLEKENFDKALETIGNEISGGTSVTSPEGEKLQIEKARILIAKGRKLKGADAEGAGVLFNEAVKLLREVILSGGVNVREANEVMADVLREGNVELDLGPVGKLSLAEANMMNKLYPEAEKLLKSIVNAPGQIEGMDIAFRARLLLAQCYRFMNEFEKSLKEFEDLIRKYPNGEDTPKVALERCWTLALYARSSHNKEIEERYIQALRELAQKFPEAEEGRNAWYYLGEALRQRGRFAEATEAYKRVGKDSKYYGRSRFVRGLSLYSEFREKARRRNIDRAMLKEAETELIWAVTQGKPGLGQTWHHKATTTLCDLYYGTQRYEKVLDAAKLFVDRFPEEAKGSGDLLFRRMRALTQLDRFDEADKELAALTEQDPDPKTLLRGYLTLADALLKKAATLEASSKHAESRSFSERAKKALARAVDLVAEDDADVWVWVAGKLYRVGDIEGALKACVGGEKAYAITKKLPDEKLWQLRLLRLKCLDLLDKWGDGAEKLLEELEERYPYNADIKMKRAAYLQKFKKEYEKAEEIWKKVAIGVKMGSPAYLEAQHNRVLCLEATGQKERGREIIRIVRGQVRDMTPDMKRKFDELDRRLK